MKFPIIAFKNNIVFSDTGEAFAIYRLRGESYHHLPGAEREMVIRRLEQFLYGFEGRGMILLLCEELRLDEDGYLGGAGVTGLSGDMVTELRRHARSVRGVLALGARRRRRYLVLQLRLTRDEDWQALLREFRDAALGALFRSERWLLSSGRIQEATEAEEEMFRRVSLLTERRIDFGDLDFIIRRNVRRVGVLPLPLPSRDGGRLTPALVASFSDGCLLEEKLSYLTVSDGFDDRHHQLFITFPDFPKVLPEVGAEWLAGLDAGEAAVDAVIHFNIMRPYRAKRKAESRRRFLKGQIREALKGDVEPSTDEEYGFTEGRFLEGKLGGGQPLASVSVALAVASRDLREARAAGKRLMERYSSSGFRAVCPVGDQLKCLYSFIPGSRTAAPLIECDPGFIASSGLTVSLEMGDGAGFFLGWSGSSPVMWKPGHAARYLNRSNAIFINGGLGGGKSMLAKLLLYLAYMAGAHLFVIDPKNNEYAVLERIFNVRKIDLYPGGNVQLNPFLLSGDSRRAGGIAMDYLSIVLNLKDDNDARRVAVARAVDAVGKLPEGCRNMRTCLEELFRLSEDTSYPDVAREAGQCALLLEALRDGSMGHLVFGTDTAAEVPRATVVNLRGLPLPQTKGNMQGGRITESERQGLGMLFLASAMAREMAFSLPPEVLKCVTFDESWMILGISEGRRMVDEIVRMGARTFGVIPVLITQNATDISDLQTIRNNVGYVFCFRAQDRAEISANLELLGADREDEKAGPGLGSIFRSMESGWCVMRDAAGRIGHVCIDPRPDYLLRIFDTSPGSVGGVWNKDC